MYNRIKRTMQFDIGKVKLILRGKFSHYCTSLVQPKSTRFKFATEDVSTFAKGLVPENTTRSTKWALNTFSAWIKERNARYPANTSSHTINTGIQQDASIISKFTRLYYQHHWISEPRVIYSTPSITAQQHAYLISDCILSVNLLTCYYYYDIVLVSLVLCSIYANT